MEYQLDLPTHISVSPAAFVATWNASSSCRAFAEAHLVRPVGAPLDPSIFDELPLLSSSVMPDYAPTALCAPVQLVLAACGMDGSISLAVVAQPDGAYIVIVTLDEPLALVPFDRAHRKLGGE